MRRTRVLSLLIFASLILALGACGKKGPPFLPTRFTPPKVVNLNAEWKDGSVLLKGEILYAQGQKRGTPGSIGCKVYHAWYGLENSPCEGCPIEYRLYQEVRKDIFQGDAFYCQIEGIRKRGVHFFKVSLRGNGGRTGLLSEGAKLVLE